MPKKLIKKNPHQKKKQNRGKNKIQKITQIQGKNQQIKQTLVVKSLNKKTIKIMASMKQNPQTKNSQTSQPKTMVTIPENYWTYQDDEPERQSASRYQNPYGEDLDDEEQKKKNKINQSRYNPSSINYHKNEYNQRQNNNNIEKNMGNYTEIKKSYAATYYPESAQQQEKLNQNKNEAQQESQTRRNQRYMNRNENKITYQTRSKSSSSRSNQRYNRQNNNRNRSNSRNRNYQQTNQQSNKWNTNQRSNYQRKKQQQYKNNSITTKEQQQTTKTLKIIQNKTKIYNQTCRYWLDSVCRDPECERQHFQQIQIMDLYHQQRGRRFKNNITDQNNLQQDINKQKFNITIKTNREMTIKEIRDYISMESQQLEEKQINNIEIQMAVKDPQQIQLEIKNIINLSIQEMEKEQEIINQTQAALIATDEVLQQISKEEFIKIREAFSEINKEQEYQNERSREYHQKQIDKYKKEQQNQNNKQMEIEENSIRHSQIAPIFKPQIQQNQFINFQKNKIHQQNNNINQTQNISEEDKVNQAHTSSSEDKQPQQQSQAMNWDNITVRTSINELQTKENSSQESLKIVDEAVFKQQIGFQKISNKKGFLDYLTHFNPQATKEATDIPTGLYLILLIKQQYLNEQRQKARNPNAPHDVLIYLSAYAEAISTYALANVNLKVEDNKLKLDCSRTLITNKLIEIINSGDQPPPEEIYQIRTINEQGTTISIIIHITSQFENSKIKIQEII